MDICVFYANNGPKAAFLLIVSLTMVLEHDNNGRITECLIYRKCLSIKEPPTLMSYIHLTVVIVIICIDHVILADDIFLYFCLLRGSFWLLS